MPVSHHLFRFPLLFVLLSCIFGCSSSGEQEKNYQRQQARISDLIVGLDTITSETELEARADSINAIRATMVELELDGDQKALLGNQLDSAEVQVGARLDLLREQQLTGLSYDGMMAYLSNFYEMEQSLVDGVDRYMGATNYTIFEMMGEKENLSSTTLVLINPEDPAEKFRNSAIMIRFLKNALPEWEGALDWVNGCLQKFGEGSADHAVSIQGNKRIKITFVPANSMFSITVKSKYAPE